MRSMALFDNGDGKLKMTFEWADAEQGFIDQYGQWMTREEAWLIAEAAGQIKYAAEHSKGTLYSEDLY